MLIDQLQRENPAIEQDRSSLPILSFSTRRMNWEEGGFIYILTIQVARAPASLINVYLDDEPKHAVARIEVGQNMELELRFSVPFRPMYTCFVEFTDHRGRIAHERLDLHSLKIPNAIYVAFRLVSYRAEFGMAPVQSRIGLPEPLASES